MQEMCDTATPAIRYSLLQQLLEYTFETKNPEVDITYLHFVPISQVDSVEISMHTKAFRFKKCTLAIIGNKHSLRVSWRNYFFSRAVVSVFGSGGKQVLVLNTYNLEYNTVVVLCWFFCSGGKQFLVLRTYLVYNTVVRLCQEETHLLCKISPASHFFFFEKGEKNNDNKSVHSCCEETLWANFQSRFLFSLYFQELRQSQTERFFFQIASTLHAIASDCI